MTEEDDKVTEVLSYNDHDIDLVVFRTKLLEWGHVHKREFPWRTTDNPFHILLAELMLRRTHARQVAAIFPDFISRYPDPQTLVNAEPGAVAKSLYSLGLAWRVPAFQQVASILLERFNGCVPSNFETLISLPGVGDYVASAVSSFAFNKAVPIIDTNTVRVAGRLFNVKTHPDSRKNRGVRRIMTDLLDENRPKEFNYCLLDLAALLCTPQSPKCEDCPVVHFCATGLKRTTQ